MFPIENTLLIAAVKGRAVFVFVNAKDHARHYFSIQLAKKVPFKVPDTMQKKVPRYTGKKYKFSKVPTVPVQKKVPRYNCTRYYAHLCTYRNFNNIPTDLDNLDAKLLIWFSKFNLESIVMPWYFTDSLMETELSWKSISEFGNGLIIFGGITKANDFWGFTVILLACARSTTFCNSEYSFYHINLKDSSEDY